MGRAEPGRVIAAQYRLRSVIRRDDLGAVWLAGDGLRHRDVVLREIPWAPPSGAAEQESRREHLLREARAVAQIGHPNIVRVLAVAEEDGQPWLVFDPAPYRFPHRPLSDVVRNDGPLRPEQAARAGLQVLAAVRQAHAVGVLHRDIKPGSILLGPGNRVLLADFGMVTAAGSPGLTMPDAFTGSPLYLAPERAMGAPATPAADLWSLGATLYAAVEGRAPFGRDGAAAVLTEVVTACPDPPRRAGPLWPVLSGLLRKDPGARPDADALDWLLRRVAGEHGPPPLAALIGNVSAAGAALPPAVVAAHQPRAEADAGSAAPAGDAGSAAPAGVAGSAAPAGDAGSAAPAGVAGSAAPAAYAGNAAPADDAGIAAPAEGVGNAAAAEDAGNAASAEDFIPGFGPRDHPPAAPEPHARRPWRRRSTVAGKAGR